MFNVVSFYLFFIRNIWEEDDSSAFIYLFLIVFKHQKTFFFFICSLSEIFLQQYPQVCWCPWSFFMHYLFIYILNTLASENVKSISERDSILYFLKMFVFAAWLLLVLTVTWTNNSLVFFFLIIKCQMHFPFFMCV